MKYILIATFFFLNTLLYYVTQKNIEQIADITFEAHIHELQVHYETFLSTQSMNADIIFTSVVDKEGLKEKLKRLVKAQTKAQEERARQKLIDELFDKYDVMKQGGVLQFHFISEDNISLLRMHKPSKYGDNLTEIRKDIAWVNKTHKVFRGFSQGRTAHAFRNVYPVFEENGDYLCAVEISYPSEILQKNLNIISKIPSQFLVDKKLFESKAWSREDLVLEYAPSKVSPNYLLTRSNCSDAKLHGINIDERLKNLHNEINTGLSEGKTFALMSNLKNTVVVITFIPVLQNSTKNVVA
ncbi:MAG: hypothetical protein JXQ67_04265 [Campylobacterales bacterium]|nr:hypothetical protein [Campylobacterales bacterium]